MPLVVYTDPGNNAGRHYIIVKPHEYKLFANTVARRLCYVWYLL